jgi:hypothetical protein
MVVFIIGAKSAGLNDNPPSGVTGLAAATDLVPPDDPLQSKTMCA